MIDPLMLACVTGVALVLSLLVVFGSWVEDVARSEKYNVSLELGERPATSEQPYEKGEL